MNVKSFYFCIVGLTIFIVVGCQPRSRAEVDQIIAHSEKLSKIDWVCQSVPKPADFIELRKGLGGNAAHSSIEYQYKTSRSFDTVVAHFKNECDKAQCTIVSEYDNENDKSYRTLTLRIDGVLIVIEYRADFGSLINYGCSM
jgi:hypothetical protein